MGKSSTVWVTGASGFIGTHLVRQLAAAEIAVVGFGRRNAAPLGCAAYFPGPLNVALERAVETLGAPMRVFHLAGSGTVGRSIADPLSDFDSNVTTTALLLDALRRHAPGAAFILASSAAVYGAGHREPVATDAAMSPFSPYGHHKRMAEDLLRVHAETYGLQGTILRLFSIYGPGIRKQLLHDVCSRLATNEAPLVLGGTGTECRDWLHVEDAVRAIAGIADTEPGETAVFNVGAGVGVDIGYIAEILCSAWGERSFCFSGVCRQGDPERLVAHAASLPPGFTPRVPLEAGLRGYVHWFREAKIEELRI